MVTWIRDRFPDGNQRVIALTTTGKMAFVRYDQSQSTWKTDDSTVYGECVYAWYEAPELPLDFVPTMPDKVIKNVRVQLKGESEWKKLC